MKTLNPNNQWNSEERKNKMLESRISLLTADEALNRVRDKFFLVFENGSIRWIDIMDNHMP